MVIVFFSLALLSNTDPAKTIRKDPEQGTDVQLRLIRGDNGESRSAYTDLPGFDEGADTDEFTEDSLEFEMWMMEPGQWMKENN